MNKYTKEQLVYFLKRLAGEIKRSPTIKDLSGRKCPSANTYYNRFGSWNNSLKEAGLAINLAKRYEKKELSDNLRLLARELSRPPKASDLEGRQWTASYSTYKKYFGSWGNALRDAGLAKKASPSLKRFAKGK